MGTVRTGSGWPQVDPWVKRGAAQGSPLPSLPKTTAQVKSDQYLTSITSDHRFKLFPLSC